MSSTRRPWRARLGQLGVGLEQRLDRRADHHAGPARPSPDVDRQRDLRRVLQGLRALGDVGGLVADAFEVAVDLDDRQDEAQVDGHGLLLGEQLVGHLVDGLRGVDGLSISSTWLQSAMSRARYASTENSSACCDSAAIASSLSFSAASC
jgi:hypothetical protein